MRRRLTAEALDTMEVLGIVTVGHLTDLCLVEATNDEGELVGATEVTLTT